MQTVTAIAPAKVNLILDVAPLDEGKARHNVDTTMQALTLHDTLVFQLAENEDDVEEFRSHAIKLSNQNYGVKDVYRSEVTQGNITVGITTIDTIGQHTEIPACDNLIARAIFSFCFMPGMKDKFFINVEIDKQIPAQAGLGGGSSDCAAALVACESLLSDKFSTMPDINKIAGELGADVAFFLHGGRARMSGSGAIFEEQLPSLKDAVVLVKPESGVSTAEAYKLFDALMPGMNMKKSKGEELFNNLQGPAMNLNPEIKEILEFLGKDSLLCGSGSCCFKICDSFEKASKIAGDAALHNWWSRPCYFANIKASLK